MWQIKKPWTLNLDPYFTVHASNKVWNYIITPAGGDKWLLKKTLVQKKYNKYWKILVSLWASHWIIRSTWFFLTIPWIYNTFYKQIAAICILSEPLVNCMLFGLVVFFSRIIVGKIKYIRIKKNRDSPFIQNRAALVCHLSTCNVNK